MAVRARRSTSSSSCSTPRRRSHQQRPDDPAGQLAAPGQRRVGHLAELGPDDRVLPVGDPERVELGLGQPEARDDLVGRRLGAAAARRASSPPPGGRRSGGRRRRARCARRPGRGCRRRCPAAVERRRVDPGRVAVAALEVDRPVRHDPVEVGPIAGCRPGSPPSTSRRRRSTARPGGSPRSAAIAAR